MRNGKNAYCDECGAEGTIHALIWLDSAADALSLRMPLYRVPFYDTLMRVADMLIESMGRLFFALGSFLGLVSISEDPATAVSDRSRLLWIEAQKRGIRMQHLLIAGKPTDTFRIQYKGATYFFKSLPLAVLPRALAMDDKVLFKERLLAASLPVPRSYSVRNKDETLRAFHELGTVCIKPRTGSNGRHTYPYVRTEDEALQALARVRMISPFASIEEHLEGNLCRATCVDGTLVGFLESEHPHVVGDGVATIRELIDHSNENKQPGTEDLVLGDSIEGYIQRRGYTPDSVLPEGERLQLSYRGGRSVASTNREHGRSIHPSFIPFIEEAAVRTELPVVGFDIIIPNPLEAASGQRWGFIEANSLPWIDLHARPYYGEPHDVSVEVWDMWERQHAR